MGRILGEPLLVFDLIVSMGRDTRPDSGICDIHGRVDALDHQSLAQLGCGACVAACPNASAALFTGAKIAHLGLLPQGQPERHQRALKMVRQYNAEGFGGCTNIGE